MAGLSQAVTECVDISLQVNACEQIVDSGMLLSLYRSFIYLIVLQSRPRACIVSVLAPGNMRKGRCLRVLAPSTQGH